MTDLLVQKRSELGKQAKKLRLQGLIPAVVYGGDKESAPITVSEKEFTRVLEEAGETTIIQLAVEGDSEKVPVMIYDVTKDPMTDKVIHADFFRVNLKEEITASVPLEFVGESPLIKNEGGILVKSLQEVEIKALPAEMPHEIEVDTSVLKSFDDKIHVKDLSLPDKVEIMEDPETVVALVTLQEEEKEEEAPAPAPVSETATTGEKPAPESEEKEQN